MSIRNSLSRLESSGGGSPISDHMEPLAGLLGSIDALFMPHRERQGASAIAQRQRRYRDHGIVWQSAVGGSSRAWKSDERLRASLVESNLITVHKSSGAVPGVKITAVAENAIRRALGLSVGSRELLALINVMAGQDDGSADYRSGGWVSECRLFGGNYVDRPSSAAWHHDTEVLLPLLVAGCIESRSSPAGHIFYRVTGKPFPQFEPIDIEPASASVQEIYSTRFTTAVQDRKLSEPLDHDEVYISLSATR